MVHGIMNSMEYYMSNQNVSAFEKTLKGDYYWLNNPKPCKIVTASKTSALVIHNKN